MKKLSFAAVIVGALLLASCATNRTMSSVTLIDADNYVVDVKPMIATLQVQDTHVDGEFRWEGKKRASVNYEELRDNAIYDALRKRQADVLVAPQYQTVTEIRGNRKYIRVYVTGYPAIYVNFVPAPQNDILEVKELKADANYVLVTKDTEGAVRGAKVVVPYDKDLKTLDLDEATVDKVILDGNKARIGRSKKVKRNDPSEQQNFLDKLSDRFSGNRPKKQEKK